MGSKVPKSGILGIPHKDQQCKEPQGSLDLSPVYFSIPYLWVFQPHGHKGTHYSLWSYIGRLQPGPNPSGLGPAHFEIHQRYSSPTAFWAFNAPLEPSGQFMDWTKSHWTGGHNALCPTSFYLAIEEKQKCLSRAFRFSSICNIFFRSSLFLMKAYFP